MAGSFALVAKVTPSFFRFLFIRTVITGLLHSREGEAGEKKQERLAWCETLEARPLVFFFSSSFLF